MGKEGANEIGQGTLRRWQGVPCQRPVLFILMIRFGTVLVLPTKNHERPFPNLPHSLDSILIIKTPNSWSHRIFWILPFSKEWGKYVLGGGGEMGGLGSTATDFFPVMYPLGPFMGTVIWTIPGTAQTRSSWLRTYLLWGDSSKVELEL